MVCAEGATGQWVMLSNIVGVDQAESRVLPNLGHGVSISSGCDGAAIGTIGLDQGNIIAHNLKAGIRVADGTSSVRGNSVFLNGELGIDAGEDGVTPNDTADALLPVNFPEVEETIRAGGSLVVKGCVVAGATIDVYEASADPSGFGEGKQHLGAIVEGGVLGDDEQRGCSAENDATFSLTVETGVISITLTATSSGRTSEFSPVYSEAGEDPDPGCDTDASCQAPTPVCNPCSGGARSASTMPTRVRSIQAATKERRFVSRSPMRSPAVRLPPGLSPSPTRLMAVAHSPDRVPTRRTLRGNS